MATINSHRRRTVYHNSMYAYNRNYSHVTTNVPPAAAAIMMPAKATNADAYAYGGVVQFANLHDITQRKYLGNTLRRMSNNNNSYYNGTSSSPSVAYTDVIKTSPSCMMNPYDNNNRYRFRVSASPSGNPVVYFADQSGVSGYLGYSRKAIGVNINGHHAYKRVKTGSNSSTYGRVMAISDMMGGNIKTRATTAKWAAGMWREK